MAKTILNNYSLRLLGYQIMKLNLELDIKIVESFEDPDTIARCYYPNEGNRIEILKGLNRITVDFAIRHEIGHMIDWYISEGKQSTISDVRETIADNIAESIKNI